MISGGPAADEDFGEQGLSRFLKGYDSDVVVFFFVQTISLLSVGENVGQGKSTFSLKRNNGSWTLRKLWEHLSESL